jgi:hypothetical protein
VFEAELLGEGTNGGGSGPIEITSVSVGAREDLKERLIDGSDEPPWRNDSDIATAWFELELNGTGGIEQLKLAPRTDRRYRFNVYVDGSFIGQYTMADADVVELQTFDLPAGTRGSTVRVESDKHRWFKIYVADIVGQRD